MLLTGPIWKLQFISAVFSLVSLPAAELAEVAHHPLLRRHPPPPPGTPAGGPVRCGRNYDAVEDRSKIQAGQISCTAYKGHNYYCEQKSCHAGKLVDLPTTPGKTLDGFVFKECKRYPLPGESGIKLIPSTHPNQYWYDFKAQTVWVRGWDDPKDKRARIYQCTWDESHQNNRYPIVCNKCTHEEFTNAHQPTPPPN